MSPVSVTDLPCNSAFRLREGYQLLLLILILILLLLLLLLLLLYEVKFCFSPFVFFKRFLTAIFPFLTQILAKCRDVQVMQF